MAAPSTFPTQVAFPPRCSHRGLHDCRFARPLLLALMFASAGCGPDARTPTLAPQVPVTPASSDPVLNSARAINRGGAILGDVWAGPKQGSWVDRDGVFTPLGALWGLALNDLGVVVGGAPVFETYRLPDGRERFIESGYAAMWQGGKQIDLGKLPGDNISQAWAVNDAGDVVGFSSITDGEELQGYGSAVMWPKGGAITVLAPLAGDVSAQVVDINDAGQAVGTSFPSGIITIWERGVPAAVHGGGIENGSYTRAIAINDSGQILGYTCPVEAKCRSFVWERGQLRWLDPSPECAFVQVNDLDDLGRAVGVGLNCSGRLPPERALLWLADGRVVELPEQEKYRSVQANAINAGGQIAGSATIDGTVKGSYVVRWSIGGLSAEGRP